MKRIVMFASIVFAVIAAIAILMLQPSDTISRGNLAIAEMLNELSPVRKIADEHFLRTQSEAEIQAAERVALPHSEDGRRQFLALKGGVLIGVDFQRNALVVLTPKSSKEGLRWDCVGLPQSAAPKTCK